MIKKADWASSDPEWLQTTPFTNKLYQYEVIQFKTYRFKNI
jgi:hypothetical protein